MPFGQHGVLVLTKRHVGSGNEIGEKVEKVEKVSMAIHGRKKR